VSWFLRIFVAMLCHKMMGKQTVELIISILFVIEISLNHISINNRHPRFLGHLDHFSNVISICSLVFMDESSSPAASDKAPDPIEAAMPQALVAGGACTL
jgi:hypothetical protein